MVVLSSGTLGTPQILERSGVGNAELLEQLGIKVVSDLPGVGYVFEAEENQNSSDLLITREEYQDHYTTLTRE